MENKRIRDIEGYEAFKAECSFFRCEEEYPGWVGEEKYGIITALSREELETKYPRFVKAMSPYVLLDLEYGRIRAEAMKNDEKFEKRSKFSDHIFEMDDEATELHPELSVKDFLSLMEENDAHVQWVQTQQDKCNKALSHLKEIQKTRLIKRYVLGMKVKDIAAEENTSCAAVSKSIANAEEKFRLFFHLGLISGTPNSIHYGGVDLILKQIAASKKTDESNEENQNEQ